MITLFPFPGQGHHQLNGITSRSNHTKSPSINPVYCVLTYLSACCLILTQRVTLSTSSLHRFTSTVQPHIFTLLSNLLGYSNMKRRRNGNHIYTGEQQASQHTPMALDPIHVTVVTKRKKARIVTQSYITTKTAETIPSPIPEPPVGLTNTTPPQDPETTATNEDGVGDPQDPSPKKVFIFYLLLINSANKLSIDCIC